MELFLRQQFEALLQEATGSFAERTIYRCGGPAEALAALQQDPESVHRSAFVEAFFTDSLLDNPAGHAFVLEALERRTVPDLEGGTVADVLGRLARTAFADVLTTMTTQLIQRQQIYS